MGPSSDSTGKRFKASIEDLLQPPDDETDGGQKKEEKKDDKGEEADPR
jgi:hypothetical protein